MPEDDGYLYLVRKRRKFWGSSRYEYTQHETPGRARGAVKSSVRQGYVPPEPIKIYRVPKEALEEIFSYDGTEEP